MVVLCCCVVTIPLSGTVLYSFSNFEHFTSLHSSSASASASSAWQLVLYSSLLLPGLKISFGLFSLSFSLVALFCCMFWLSWTPKVHRPIGVTNTMFPCVGDMVLRQWLLELCSGSQRSTDPMMNTLSFYFIIWYIVCIIVKAWLESKQSS